MQPSNNARSAPSQAEETYLLRLYVAGQTPKSILAFRNLKQICEEHLHGRYEIEVIDLIENPQLAQGDQILAVPTLGTAVAGTDQEDHRRPLEHGPRPRGPRLASAPLAT